MKSFNQIKVAAEKDTSLSGKSISFLLKLMEDSDCDDNEMKEQFSNLIEWAIIFKDSFGVIK